ncbi:MAG: hypothetical protein COZ34_03945 [Candidatus Pacebacteria bacterium CG_4_10_14_3_um_filter_34_15]|nr:type II toxin-antitoxin system RelE/ParE family toxin [Candidatus Paceibacterota bacterium]PIX81316.1 MAG: hypothetical protein COZ34_03945 [Candidatus Pacebacteria bacterium CG_4_10_14_3_um_filter_34_15]PJC43396.1 MAG: hypothetical protein CO039_04460 [Candidatus Pacebacteria bacterium CG_4_9_14_0_2_um_filter_34_50]
MWRHSYTRSSFWRFIVFDYDLGTYRYHIGNHRVIFDLEKNKIVVLRIGHRKEIYR